ncbi:MAG TPA: sigma-70 family RNA polymerase sigma factor [Burkholderiaceae bacterium]|nr:sigma-70 family RNA polymerase sigma factor [Burkholderiaceae bacterium]
MQNASANLGLDDAELARRIASAPDGSDVAAETELYRRLAPRVRLYGLKHLRDRQAASDLAQQVLLLTLERLRAGKLRDAEQLVSFVFGTCRMMVLELRRTGARRERLLELYADDVPMADPAATPRLDQARLVDCLERLPERERSVLVMTFYDDQPAREVGVALGLSEGNVRVIRHRGIERLRDCVTEGLR